MFQILPVSAAAVAALLSYFYITLRRKRARFAKFPQLPVSMLWGHLKAIDEQVRSGVPERHPDQVFQEIHESLGRPPLFVLDLWPLFTPAVISCSHEVAEQVAKSSKTFPWSAPKTPVPHLSGFIGKRSMLSLQVRELLWACGRVGRH